MSLWLIIVGAFAIVGMLAILALGLLVHLASKAIDEIEDIFGK